MAFWIDGTPALRHQLRQSEGCRPTLTAYLAAEAELSKHMNKAGTAPREKHKTIYDYLRKQGLAQNDDLRARDVQILENQMLRRLEVSVIDLHPVREA